MPKLTHEDLTGFDVERRSRVLRLAAMLRIADGLDRSHAQTVRAVRLAGRHGRWWIEVDAEQADVALELWAARRKVELWERCFEVELGVRLALTWPRRRIRSCEPRPEPPARR